jgi:hypothetical protein
LRLPHGQAAARTPALPRAPLAPWPATHPPTHAHTPLARNNVQELTRRLAPWVAGLAEARREVEGAVEGLFAAY